MEKIESIHRTFWLKVAEEDKIKHEVKQAMERERRGENSLYSDNDFRNGPMFPFFEGNVNPNPQPQLSSEEIARREQDRM